MTAFTIRRFHPSDLPALYDICLRTGADGRDATGTIDGELLGHYFAAPYAVLEPACAFTLTADGRPAGYIVGTADSAAFARRMDNDWLPPLRARYPLPADGDASREAELIRAIHRGYRPPAFASDYPAHLHINLLPIAQGAGLGRAMIERLLDTLREAGCSGIHLGVSPRNDRALRFYPRCGFSEIEIARGDSVWFGLRLD